MMFLIHPSLLLFATAVLCLLCGFAFVLQLAVLRAPDLPESGLSEMGRRIEICVWGSGALWYGWLFAADEVVLLRVPTFLLVAFLAFSRISVAMARLFPDHEVHAR